jgi:hypothetical protein
VLRALSLCTCCRHYPGAATGGPALLTHPVVSVFPTRVGGSTCAASFSRLARRSLALRPAHSRSHQFVARFTEGFSQFVTSLTAPVASGWSIRRVGLAPTGKRRLGTAHTHPGRHEPNQAVANCSFRAGKLGIANLHTRVAFASPNCLANCEWSATPVQGLVFQFDSNCVCGGRRTDSNFMDSGFVPGCRPGAAMDMYGLPVRKSCYVRIPLAKSHRDIVRMPVSDFVTTGGNSRLDDSNECVLKKHSVSVWHQFHGVQVRWRLALRKRGDSRAKKQQHHASRPPTLPHHSSPNLTYDSCA